MFTEDIAQCICEVLDYKTLTQFVATCLLFRQHFEFFSGRADVLARYVSTPPSLVVRKKMTLAQSIEYVENSSVVIYNCHFDIIKTMSLHHADVVFVNCFFVTHYHSRVFYADCSRVRFYNCVFELSAALGKCISLSEMVLNGCCVISLINVIPLVTLRMSSCVCTNTFTRGGNVFCFINGKPKHALFHSCICCSTHGVETFNCKIENNSIVNCKSYKNFLVTTNTTHHFYRGSRLS